MAKKKQARVLGPYVEGERWRIVEIAGAGKRTARYYPTLAQANRAKRTAGSLLRGAAKLDEMIGPYLADGELLPRTQRVTAASLRSWLEGQTLDNLTPRRAA